MFSFARRSSSRSGDKHQQSKTPSKSSSIFSLSRKSSITSFRANGATSAQSSTQSSAFASGHTSAYNSRPPSALLHLRHVDSNDEAGATAPVSAKAATLLGIAGEDAQQQAAQQSPGTTKPWFKRGRRIRRKTSLSSMLSQNTLDNGGAVDDDDKTSSRRPSESQSRNSTSASGMHISSPTDFQHIAHARPKHFSRINLASSQNELVAEFSAVRASQVPARALRGIKVAEIHSRNSSIDRPDYSFAPSLRSKNSRDSMLGSGLASPTAMQSPRPGNLAEAGANGSQQQQQHQQQLYTHRYRQSPAANLPPWSPVTASTRFAPNGYYAHSSHPPTSPTHVRSEEIGVAVPMEPEARWSAAEPADMTEYSDGDFHALSTPGDQSWEMHPSSSLPFELMPALDEEDESNLSRPVSSVTAFNRGSVIHHGKSQEPKPSSASTLSPAAARHSTASREKQIVAAPVTPEHAAVAPQTWERLPTPPSPPAHDLPKPQQGQGLFSAWHADSETSSVADGEALVALSEGDYRVSAALNAPPSPSASTVADSWRDSQTTTVPYVGQDDYNALLDDIISLEKPTAAWLEQDARRKERPRTQSPIGQSKVNAYPMSPDDGDEDLPFDPYTAPLPRRPDSLVTEQPPAAIPTKSTQKQATPSIKSDRTSASIMSGKDKIKRNSSTSKKVAFAEAAGDDERKHRSSSSKSSSSSSKVPVRQHSRSSSVTDAPSSRASLDDARHESSRDKQRHSTGQVKSSKSSHSRKLSAPDPETPSRRSSKRSSGSSRSVTTTATHAGYSFVRLSAPPASSSYSTKRVSH